MSATRPWAGGWAAHLGGFAGGWLVGTALFSPKEHTRAAAAVAVAVLAAALAVVFTCAERPSKGAARVHKMYASGSWLRVGSGGDKK
jgi:predicted lipid-binding transport protein (Tim44 family)